MLKDSPVSPERRYLPAGRVLVTYARSSKNLRAKLEQDPRQPRYIETVFGVGYRFHKD